MVKFYMPTKTTQTLMIPDDNPVIASKQTSNKKLSDNDKNIHDQLKYSVPVVGSNSFKSVSPFVVI